LKKENNKNSLDKAFVFYEDDFATVKMKTKESLKGQVLKYKFQFESNLYCSLSVRGSRVGISPHASKKEGRSLSLSVINV
jgi:hypothetical protein